MGHPIKRFHGSGNSRVCAPVGVEIACLINSYTDHNNSVPQQFGFNLQREQILKERASRGSIQIIVLKTVLAGRSRGCWAERCKFNRLL